MAEMEIYRQVKMSERIVDKTNKYASLEGRSFAAQSKLIYEMGMKEYERKNK